LQEEIFQMFEADRMEIELSKNMLRNKIQAELPANLG
jgi:hypothetical protein